MQNDNTPPPTQQERNIVVEIHSNDSSDDFSPQQRRAQELEEHSQQSHEEDEHHNLSSFVLRRPSVPRYLSDRRKSSTVSIGSFFDNSSSSANRGEGRSVRFEGLDNRRRSSILDDIAVTISEDEVHIDDDALQKAKDILVKDLSPDHVPLTHLTSKKQIILPTELSALKEIAIEQKVMKRDKKLEKWFKRAHTGLASAVSMDTISKSLSVETLFQKEKESFKNYLKELCFYGPCWDPMKGKKKIYDVREEDLLDVQGIIIDLGYALSTYGMTSHRLEYHMAIISSYYGVNCTVWSTPTGLWFCFGNLSDDIDAKTYLVPIKGSSLNLSKLCLLDDLAEKIARGKMSIKEARTEIKRIIQAQPVYNHFMFTIFSAFLQSGVFSVFFSANLGEILASFVAGLFIGILCVLANAFDSYSQINTMVCGIVSGVVGVIFKIIFASVMPISVFIVSLSGVISLLPGLTFTLAITELATRHLLSGSARLMSGFVTTIQLGFGVLVSAKLSLFVQQHLTIFPEVNTRDPPELYIVAIIIPIVAIGTIISFKAPRYPLALVFIVIDAYAGYFAAYYGTLWLGKEVGAVLGALAVGLIANVFGWISRHPNIVVSACGIIYLAPGSLGYRSVNALLNNDSTGGVTFIFDMLITAAALTIGLLISDVFAFKRKRLQL